MTMSRQTILLAVLLAALPAITFGQPATGLPPFGSFSGGPFDTVNNGNLNVHFEIPIINKAGRGLPFTYTLTYDSSVWYPYGAWTPVNNWGWSAAHCCGADGLRFIQRRPTGTLHLGRQPILLDLVRELAVSRCLRRIAFLPRRGVEFAAAVRPRPAAVLP